MPGLREHALDLLARLGAQPATSFYEDGVASVIIAILAEHNISYQLDRYGNILAKIPGAQTGISPIAFMAHMDHPGFEIIAADGDYLIGQAMGGVPPASFGPGVPLQVILPDRRRLGATTARAHGEESARQALIKLNHPQPILLPQAAVFDLVDFTLDGDFIRMRALDDLAGCGSILAALASLTQGPAPGDVYGVFTHAEEVGLIGARLLAEAGTLPKETLVVSLESSRTLPGAEIGNGPVIRVGDAGFTFNAEAESALLRGREILQGHPNGFKSQRQLMSGGSCEASGFALYGYRATGIAFPLGNYHNGAPEGRIEAEYIHVDDFIGGVELIMESARHVQDRHDTRLRQRLARIPDEYRQRLQPKVG